MKRKTTEEVSFGKIIEFIPSEKDNNVGSKSWVCTDFDVSELRKKFWLDLDKTRLAIGLETCPETKKKHFQIFITLKRTYRWKAWQKIIGSSYFAKAKCDDWNYCLKEMNYTIQDYRRQGTRNDLIAAKKRCLEEGMRSIVLENNLQVIRTCEKVLYYLEKPRDWKPTVIWIWGPSGIGKSRKARTYCKDPSKIYTKNRGGKWWCGYDAHEVVILDDFRDSWFDYTEILSLLDRYEKRIEVKGGSRQFKAKTIIITSLFAPTDCYLGLHRDGDDQNQLIRRIDSIIHLT